MTIDHASTLGYDILLFLGAGGVGIAFVYWLLRLPGSTERKGAFVLASIAAVGLPMAIMGVVGNSNARDDLNAQFAEKLQQQYGATSDLTYTEIRDGRDSGKEFALFDRDGEKANVLVVFLENGEITLFASDASNYEPLDSAS